MDEKDHQSRNSYEYDKTNVEAMFDKKEYYSYDFFNNTTILITIINNLEEDLQLRVDFLWSHDSIEGYSAGHRLPSFNISVSACAQEIISYNISSSTINSSQLDSLLSYNKCSFISTLRISLINNSKGIRYSNQTTIYYLVPFSIKIMQPIQNDGHYIARKNKVLEIVVNVTNYSSGTVEGYITCGRAKKAIHIDAGKSKETSLELDPLKIDIFAGRKGDWEADFSVVFIFENYKSTLGYDRDDNRVFNITAARMHLTFVDILKLEMELPDLVINVPSAIGMSVVSKSDTMAENLKFHVEIKGYLSERISHDGTFVILELRPDEPIKINYLIYPHVSGIFSIIVETFLMGSRIQSIGILHILSNITITTNLKNLEKTNHFAVGDVINIYGEIKNLYSDVIYDLRISVVVLNIDFHGLLEERDYLIIEPRSIVINSLLSGQSREFETNVRFMAPGEYRIHVLACWGKNATQGGLEQGSTFYISRQMVEDSFYLKIIIIVPIIGLIPKMIDITIRYHRKIPICK
ncbi:MAG: hypothetical protein QW379_09480 [Thermoplasmata archaeon]